MNKNDYQPISMDNLVPHYGRMTCVFCQVGIVCNLVGKLRKGFLTWHAIEIEGQELPLGFSHGQFALLEDGTISIRIN